MALVGNISGSIQHNSVIGVSGSVIIANRNEALFPVFPGTDTTFFVSGSLDGTSKSVFGGDVVVSGSVNSKNGMSVSGDMLEVTGTVKVTQGISGSLTHLTDGTSYLIASGSVEITSGSNGSVTIFVPETSGPQGAQGAQGSSGPQGVQGDVGPQGVQGDVGPQGVQGDVGPQGVQGDVGPQGVQGDVGPQGVQGDVGPQGVQGDVGPQGVQGDVGPQGVQGDVGPQGVQGDVGPQGVQGDVGPQGVQGDVGPQGVQGDTGPGFQAVASPLFTRVLTSDGTATGAVAESLFTFVSGSSPPLLALSGSMEPGTDMIYNLGSDDKRWANVHTGDLHLRNDRGNWTIIEEDDYLSIRNNKTGDMFKFVLEPIEKK